MGALRIDRNLTFLEPDTGANASAGTGGQGTQSTQTGATGGAVETSQQQQQQQQSSPWDNINLTELDEPTRRVVEAAMADHRRVAGENASLRQAAETQRQQQQRQPNQPAGQQQQQQQQQQADPVAEHVRKTLRARGFTDQQIEQQAPIFTEMFSGVLPVLRDQLGRDFAPLAGTVISHENENNFRDAQTSEAGQRLFANPAVAQEVWNIVEQRTQAGQQFDTASILNLAKMVYFDHPPQGETSQQQQQQQPAQTGSSFFPNMQPAPAPQRSTGFSYPGAGFVRPTVQQTNPNAGRHQVNDDTRAALAQTFGEISRTTGVAPKDFPSTMARTGAGARQPAQR